MKLAFVIPWFGFDISGGAEALCRSTALKLREAGLPVEVLTTCIKDFSSDWSKNYHSPGLETVQDLPIRRFRVERRDSGEYERINRRLMRRAAINPDDELTFIREMIHCDDLIDFLAAHEDQYVFMYIPYMFTSTYRGTLACPDRSVLIPCLHEESYAYLGIYQPMFAQARGVIFLSRPERSLAQRLFAMRPDAPVLIGGGIGTDCHGRAARFKQTHGLDRFLLYAGRKIEGKNIHLLVEYFCRFKETHPSDLQLVLIGEGAIDIPRGHESDVVDLGYLSRQDTADAYAAALCLCQPSVHESFSLVLMEAWSARTPVLVHEGCAVTRDHCLASNGGLYFSSFHDFVGCLELFLHQPEQARRLARNGRDYVQANYSWDRVVTKYRQALAGWGFDF